MARKKLFRFEDNKTLPNLFQPDYQELVEGFFLRGKWRELYFKNNNPIVLELGCGKGEYTVGLASHYTEKNFIGLDLKGSRMWVGCTAAIEKGLKNVGFIRRHISGIPLLFGKNEVDEIWITFPDPHLRKSDAKRRLTSPEFITRYNEILKPGGIIHLKTDSEPLWEYTMNVVKENNFKLVDSSSDVYKDKTEGAVTKFQTYYEKIWLEQGLSIKYVSFIPRVDENANLSFFEKVWEICKKIPQGKITTYGAIAAHLGTTSSARMVAWALNASKNNLENIPAHRVVNRNGVLTGKFHFEGINEMQRLLISEGIKVENDKIVDFDKVFWKPE